MSHVDQSLVVNHMRLCSTMLAALRRWRPAEWPKPINDKFVELEVLLSNAIALANDVTISREKSK